VLVRDPLGVLLGEVAAGRPPAADLSVTVLPRAPGRAVAAVLGFVAHHVVAADVDPDWVRRTVPAGSLSARMGPAFLTALAGWVGVEPGGQDMVLVARPGRPTRPTRPTRATHPSCGRPTAPPTRGWTGPGGTGTRSPRGPPTAAWSRWAGGWPAGGRCRSRWRRAVEAADWAAGSQPRRWTWCRPARRCGRRCTHRTSRRCARSWPPATARSVPRCCSSDRGAVGGAVTVATGRRGGPPE